MSNLRARYQLRDCFDLKNLVLTTAGTASTAKNQGLV
jgi:hypothetical protein